MTTPERGYTVIYVAYGWKRRLGNGMEAGFIWGLIWNHGVVYLNYRLQDDIHNYPVFL